MSCAIALLTALVLAACWGKADLDREPHPTGPPRLTLEQIPGTYVGSMLTPSGVEAVILEIREVASMPEGLVFSYRINVKDTREDGLGTMRVDGTTTRLCFDSRLCGRLLAGSDRVRIAAEPAAGEMVSAWALEKL